MDENVITVEELQEKLSRNEKLFILDVRPSAERAEWKIAGSAHIDAYKQLKEGVGTALDEVHVPEDSTIVTVCAAGRTSLLASRLLHQKGLNAYSLKGGMKAWNYAWNTAEMKFDNAGIVQVRRAAKGVLSYVVGSAGEAVVIDAALDPDVYRQLAEDNGWTIRFVIDTHIHADYVSRSRELAAVTGAKHVMIENADVDFEFLAVRSGESIKFGDAALKVLHTPGHTWESAALILDEQAIFTGDTLFVDGVGRPDLKADQAEAKERAKALYDSLKRILAFHPGVMVLPAHTTDAVPFDKKIIADAIGNIGERIKLSRLTASEFVDYALARIPPTPPNYVTIAKINRMGSYDGHVLADLEAGGNHCAIA